MFNIDIYNETGQKQGTGGGGVTDHGALTGLADDDHVQYSLISSGAGAPGTTPSRVGLVYIDTTADEAYAACGTASSADWKKTSNVASSITSLRRFDARLTLTTSVPYTTTAVTAATEAFLTPTGRGSVVSLYNGSAWADYSLAADISIKFTDTQTGTLTNGSAVVTGLTDTTQLIAGMEVTGTGIQASTVISTIDSASQITLDKTATTNGDQSLTFKVTASKVVDVFCYISGVSPKLEMVAWTDGTTRATALTKQDGSLVKTGDVTRLYVATVRMTTTAGQTEKSLSRMLIDNYYNKALWELRARDPNTAWGYTTAAWRAARNSTTVGEARVELVCGYQESPIQAEYRIAAGSSNYVFVGIGIDSTTVNSAPINTFNGAAGYVHTPAYYSGFPAVGYHYFQSMEWGATGGVFGSANVAQVSGGLCVAMMC